MYHLLSSQATDAEKADVARRERERLRLQAKTKKDQLEKVRLEQNVDAATGEVCRYDLKQQVGKGCSSVGGGADDRQLAAVGRRPSGASGGCSSS